MTGQLVFVGPQRSPTGEAIRFGAGHPNESLVGHLPDASTRVVLTMADTSQLYFNDQRKFGWVRLMPTVAIADLAFFQKLGPEPLIQTFTSKLLGERLARRKNTTIKAAILDQSVIAGIGNIYADESLWGAKIHPATLVRRVSSQKIVGLHAAMQSVLQLSIDKGGSTARTYRDAEGRKGSYLTFASVFHREGLPCPRCGHTIIKTRVAGRGTHLCPHCQRLVRKPL
jgi:formamidopyrimidine-DNA glycosylase